MNQQHAPRPVTQAKLGRIAVMGGTGLIGRHVLHALRNIGGGDVVATYRTRPPIQIPGVAWRRADLLDPAAAGTALEDVDVAVLCAGRVSTTAELRRDPVRSVNETLRIGLNTLEAASAHGLRQVVLLSSCTGYPEKSGASEESAMFAGDPPSAWFGVGWMHRFLEKQLEWHSRHLGRIKSGIALRPTLVYGPYDDFSEESGHFVPSLIRRVVNRERPIEVWGDGRQSRNLIHATDVAGAVVAALQRPEVYAAYNVASPESVSVNEVLATLLRIEGFVDADIVHRLDRSGGASALSVSAAAFCQFNGWKTSMPLHEGLAQTIDWYRKAIAGPAGRPATRLPG